jgi:YXWGXW repeat-containing protein
MKYRAVGMIIALLTLPVVGNAAAQQPPVPPEEQPAGAEVLTRGPVHEAFAEPVALQAQAGLVAPTEPPPNIEEVPSTDRPQGDSYVWIPGYWSWDADRSDYIWVSACWRVAPPDMYWAPGYWDRVSDGWEWVPGFWARAGSEEIDYLPAPPAPVDVMPRGPAPALDNVWVPGCWYWYGGGYVERRGYWLRQQPGWVWVPSHIRWTPRGYVFAEGHWDYAMQDRGVLFAPVYFPRSTYAQRGFSYSPMIALDIAVLVTNLFAYPRYSHYYFGDYYDDAYVRVGIYPRFDCERIHTWYDPIYVYDRWQYSRTDPRWSEHQRKDYERRRGDRELRPSRTYREQESRMTSIPEPQQRSMALAAPLRSVVERQATPLRLERINAETRQKVARDGAEVRRFGNERVKWEAPAAPPVPGPAGGQEQVSPARREQRGVPSGDMKKKAAATERAAPSDAPREVKVTQSERVKIPAPPIVGRPTPASGNAKRVMPAQPTKERRQQADQQKQKQKEKQKEEQDKEHGN